MRTELVEPHRLACIGITREDSRGPLVIARPRSRVPWPGIGRPVINKVEFRIVRNPSPDARPANLPGIRRPAFYSQILPAVLRVKRLESRPNQHILVRTRRIR